MTAAPIPRDLERRLRWAFLGEALEEPEWPELHKPEEAGLSKLPCNKCGDTIGWLPPGTRPENVLCAPCSVDEEELIYQEEALRRLRQFDTLWAYLPEQVDREQLFSIVEAVMCAATHIQAHGMDENVRAAWSLGRRHLVDGREDFEKKLKAAKKI